MILAYTDYPFEFLGDQEGSVGPVRQVKVLAYDTDKYCLVEYKGLRGTVKSGYLRRDKKAKHRLNNSRIESLPYFFLDSVPELSSVDETDFCDAEDRSWMHCILNDPQKALIYSDWLEENDAHPRHIEFWRTATEEEARNRAKQIYLTNPLRVA